VLLLGLSTQIKKGTSHDELQQWQMAPYVEAVLQQPRSQYIVQVSWEGPPAGRP
jgi:cytochrome c-type biogenesis protein CcmH/NrfF